ETRYANAHIDYLVKERDGSTIQRCQRLAGNHMSILYPDTGLTGLLQFTDDESHELRFVVHDFSGNETVINFQLQSYSAYADASYLPHSQNALKITNGKGLAVHKDELDVVIPAGALYEECYYEDDEVSNSEFLSKTFIVGDRYEALHKPVSIGIRPNRSVTDSMKTKALMVRIDPNGTLQAQGGTWNKDFLVAKVRKFGSYAITMDTIAPFVVKEYYPADLNTSRGGIVQLKVTDSLSGVTGINALIDEQWMLSEFDAKSGVVTIDLKGIPLNKLHTLLLEVTDERGNLNSWTDNFYW
ncbi:MAG: hypothetical protein ACKOA1_05160, partial [Bacteroidota bacterium]